MKNVRLFYTKTGCMKFVSHLDMNRFMSRVIKKSGIPIWYTEGFNPHAYITFALPLSLGFEGEYEIMDLRIEDDDYSLDMLCKKLSEVCPRYIKILYASEPVLKTGKIAFAEFKVNFDSGDKKFVEALEEFLNKDSLICSKTTKRGNVNEFDIMPKIKLKGIEANEEETVFTLILPAGSEDNVNPTILLEAFFKDYTGEKVYYGITRTKILDSEFKLFK